MSATFFQTLQIGFSNNNQYIDNICVVVMCPRTWRTNMPCALFSFSKSKMSLCAILIALLFMSSWNCLSFQKCPFWLRKIFFRYENVPKQKCIRSSYANRVTVNFTSFCMKWTPAFKSSLIEQKQQQQLIITEKRL